MVVDAAKAGQSPAGRNMPSVEEQRAFDRAFPAAVERNLAYRHGIAPMLAARCDRRHSAAAYEGKLAFLVNDAAQG